VLAEVSRNFVPRRARLPNDRRRYWLIGALHIGALMLAASAERAAADDIFVTKAPAIPFTGLGRLTGPTYDWNGFYAGGHMGVAWGQSNWTGGPGVSGTTNLFAPIDTFDEGGSWFIGLQGGYNYVLPKRILLGAEVDASFPSFQTLSGISIGGISNFTSPALGAVTYSETVLSSGTARGRIGYAPGSWLFYATGGFAWTYNQQSLTQLSTGNAETPFLWRLGWTAGAGVEVPIAPHWTGGSNICSPTTAQTTRRSSERSRSIRTSCSRSYALA
jgi:high affinity Mn2+ porin